MRAVDNIDVVAAADNFEIREGSDVALVATGQTVYHALTAAMQPGLPQTGTNLLA